MNRSRVFMVGDSISLHYGPFLKRFLGSHYEYARRTGSERFLDDEHPRGANGGDSRRVVQYLRAAAVHSVVLGNCLLMNCGLHDIRTDGSTATRQICETEYEANLREIAEIARQTVQAPGGLVVWITSTPVVDGVHNRYGKGTRYSADLARYGDIARSVMSESGVPQIDLHGFTLSLGRKESLFADHVHFPVHIQKLQAAFIAGWLHGQLGQAA